MKVFLFVEGPSDVLGLHALFEACGWRRRLHDAGWGIEVISLDSKAKLLRKIGPRAAEKLASNSVDLAVGLPDLYPREPYRGTKDAHENLDDLAALQRRRVDESLTATFQNQDPVTRQRFYGSAFKYDFEMLLLAAERALLEHTKAQSGLGHWQKPVENQNHDRPPKRIIEEIFRVRSDSKRAYLDTKDAPGVLRRVENLAHLLLSDQGQVKCPVFKGVLDWIGEGTGVAPILS